MYRRADYIQNNVRAISIFYNISNFYIYNNDSSLSDCGDYHLFYYRVAYKKIFKYKSNIKNNNIMDFIFKLGIFFGLLPFVIVIASAIGFFTPYIVLPEKILMFIDEHICDFFCFLKIIITLVIFYFIYLLWKFIFKKDKN